MKTKLDVEAWWNSQPSQQRFSWLGVRRKFRQLPPDLVKAVLILYAEKHCGSSDTNQRTDK